MIIRRFITVVLLVTLVTSAWYFFAYLTWWEWNRALVAGIMLVAAEVGLGTVLLVSKIDDLKRRVSATSERTDRINARLQAHPARSGHFEWLRPTGSTTNVFVPVLLGAGIVASGLAWLVERLARFTGGPATTGALSDRLAELAPPDGGFLARLDDPLELLQRPGGR